MRNLVAGNWKMNGLSAAITELHAMADGLPDPACEVLICPPATLIAPAYQSLNGQITLVGQTTHHNETGAHTGDVSAAMLADAGAQYVIVGHSERRVDHNESDQQISAQAQAGQDAGLCVIVCVGESRQARDSGQALDIVRAQLDASIPATANPEKLVIAYEPIWAIGTGLIPQIADIDAIHSFIRRQMIARFGASAGATIRLLYGGSMNAGNAAGIATVDDVNGGLVGGASLCSADFLPIIAAFSD